MADTKKIIREEYAKALKNVYKSNLNCCSSDVHTQQDNSCCLALKLTLTPKDQIMIPSFGSTNNLAEKANLKDDDIVVDFGSGPGHDLLHIAKIVGKKGLAIGIDFTPEMVENATKLAEKIGLENVLVYQGDIENVPLESNIADVIISNCVINLVNDKLSVFKEAYRILKPGGRLFDSDVVAAETLPEDLKEDKEILCGCIAGALTQDGYMKFIKQAGFIDIKVDLKNIYRKIKWKDNDYLTYSGIITAIKPL
ncbi:MAG: methyltransferase domain-containing protein [Candidatus Heimdallarchaeota archaeon]|nr:methyltransferase domain-containing protein [Candidatus Heimdallarchaeota archaeon]